MHGAPYLAVLFVRILLLLLDELFLVNASCKRKAKIHTSTTKLFGIQLRCPIKLLAYITSMAC